MLESEKNFDILQKSFSKEELAFAEGLVKNHCSEQCKCEVSFCIVGAWELNLISTYDFISEVKSELKIRKNFEKYFHLIDCKEPFKDKQSYELSDSGRVAWHKLCEIIIAALNLAEIGSLAVSKVKAFLDNTFSYKDKSSICETYWLPLDDILKIIKQNPTLNTPEIIYHEGLEQWVESNMSSSGWEAYDILVDVIYFICSKMDISSNDVVETLDEIVNESYIPVEN